MIVLQGSVEAGRFILWGESRPEALPRGRKPGAARPSATRISPLDPGPDRLRQAFEEVIDGEGGPKAAVEVVQVVAWLPTTDAGPVASSPIVAEAPAPSARVRLAPWLVSGLRLPTDRAIDLLLAASDRPTLAPGLVVGGTLAYWAEALRFAGSLVARQQFLPAVERTEGQEGPRHRARWSPVAIGADAPRLASLARSLPSAARAILTDPEAGPPSEPAAEVLRAFLSETVDHLVRSTGSTASTGKKPPKPRFESLHDQWLHALGTPDGTLAGDLDELDRLAAQVREWRTPIARASASPFRLGFRLNEPPPLDEEASPRKTVAPAGTWSVRYFLQGVDDPSLMIDAADAWNPKGSRAEVFRRGGFHPREYLLGSLGEASSLAPAIEASLVHREPIGFEFDASAAHAFLTETAPMLEQAGFSVMLPAWWSRKGTKLRLGARAVVKSPKMTSKSGLSLDEILKFRWEIALGDHVLTYRELQALARLKVPLVQIRGQWVQLNTEEIQAALDFWKGKSEAAMPARQLVRMALGEARTPGGLAFEGLKAEGWFSELLGQLEGKGGFENLPTPEGFLGTLRPYQARGYSWLGFLRRWGFGACLADDMGLGKTVQTLALLRRDWAEAEPKRRRPTLLVCPTSVVGNWHKEASRFTPDLPVLIHHGHRRIKGADFKKLAGKHGLVVSSFALLHRDLALLQEVPWAGVILDEAQNIKNPQTRQSQAARALKANFRIALTGTPVENHVGDLWSIMEFLNPGFLGTQAEFKRTFHVPIQVERDLEASKRLQRLTSPFLLRRLKTDKSIISDLPEKLEMKVYNTLTKEQASLYAAVVEDAANQIENAEGIQRKGLVLATLTKLKQVCNHPAQFLGDNSSISDRSGKLSRLTEMLDEALASGDKALIFTQFTEMGEILRRHLEDTFGREVPFLHGGVPKIKRDRMVERFQAPGTDAPSVFLLSVKAGGVGLNLTAANHVFHFDRWWNPAVENQATDRAFRIGQTKNVQVHKFVCLGTLEEKIDEMIERKREVAGSIVGTGEDWLTKLSTAELKDLFALRREALGD
ncbi:DEAD/DEAH box helicase [Tundrisphaera lichenicola]|uniref:DEAD/DEAH box helicase n=1 Tax=Tundrisphaera lichenicola TaxID=2029860 RepID=UPI003EB7A161